MFLPTKNMIEDLGGNNEYPRLKQSDLPEIGSRGVLSEILSGKRQLNIRQLKLLSQRFKVSPAVFI
jgi:HTH-type transcriptional regulator/antitoxin HigA